MGPGWAGRYGRSGLHVHLARRGGTVRYGQYRRRRLGGGLPRHRGGCVGRVRPGRRCRHVAGRRDRRFYHLSLPMLRCLLALLLVTFELEIHHHVDRVKWLAGFSLALLAIARQAIALFDRSRESISLSEQLEGRGTMSPGLPPSPEEPPAVPLSGLAGRCRLPALRDQAVARSMGPRRVHIDRLTR